MPVTGAISPFDPAAVTEETRALNAELIAKMKLLPDMWAFPPAQVREARRAGRGLFPLAPPSPRASTIEIAGPRGPIPLRTVRPSGAARGVVLHLHYGGWTLGSADMHDWYFERLADRAGLAVVSVDYRLAPEWPYPAGPDDCEAAALWLVREGQESFGATSLFIAGESAGAHLALVTMLRLRDRHGLKPFERAVLNAGCYDLSLTPSARAAAALDKLVLNRRDIENFVRCFVPAGVDVRHSDVSPLHADLSGLPPALLIIGTADPLLDDTLFLKARLDAAGIEAELHVGAGGCHVYAMMPGAIAEAALDRITAFLHG
jgi:acetyl esterase/lipase